MKQDKSTMQKAIEWWNDLSKNTKQETTYRFYPAAIKEHGFSRAYLFIGLPAIEKMYLSEHPEQAIKEVDDEKVARLNIMSNLLNEYEEVAVDNSKEGDWFFNNIDGDNAVVSDERGFILEAPDEQTGRELVKRWNENTSLKARIVVLENALKKNHQWALCLLADIEAGNVEYEEKYCLELNQDIAETTNLLK